MDNKTMLIVFMIVLIAFIVLLTTLGIIFITVLRKRTPVVKVVMAPPVKQAEPLISQPMALEGTPTPAAVGSAEKAALPPANEPEVESETEEEDDDDEAPTFVTEGYERVRYDRSLTAKICQLKNETKDWYSELKNDILSYEKVKDRMSWRRETFRIGKMAVARIVVRGKTLCLLLAVEPAGYNGTKYKVEDVSNVANTTDTPTLFRIKSARGLKYALEMIAGMMKELKSYKDPRYIAQDFFIPFDGDMSLMQRGLVKRIVSGSTRTYRIEEVDASEAQKEAAATGDKNPEDGK